MTKRKQLGQHFLYNGRILDKMVELAEIQADDIVLEIGAGEGSLTKKLCRTGADIISFELDRDLFPRVRDKLTAFSNLTLLNADGLSSKCDFDVLVSNLPYSISEEFVEWLAIREFRRAVVMLQTDFVNKLLSSTGRSYRAISVIAQHAFSIRKILEVPKDLFRPPPKVSSSIVVIGRNGPHMSRSELGAIKYLWSFRGKTVSSAMRILAKKKSIPIQNLLKELPREIVSLRISELSPAGAFRVANTIERA